MSILALTSNTLIGTPAAGNLEYNGQFYGTDSAAARAQMQRITLGTAVASTSGTSIDFTSIPSWVKKITVMFAGVSLNGASNLLIQIGSGSVTSSGYASGSTIAGAANSTAGLNSTAGFIVNIGSGAANIFSGVATINLINGTTWVSSYSGGLTNVYYGSNGGGVSPSLSGALDRIRITTVNGTDTFDAGSVNILYEG